MKIIGVFVCVAICTIFSSLIQAAALGKLWFWFMAAEYGPGPSMGAWFGVASILGLILTSAQPAKSKSSDKVSDESLDTLIKDMFLKWIGTWLGIAGLLGLCWVTGLILGWLH